MRDLDDATALCYKRRSRKFERPPMRKRSLSRRSFLKHAGAAAIAVSAGEFLPPSLAPLRAAESKLLAKKEELTKALEKALRHGVHGIEKHHDIARRLAINLAGMGGRSPQILQHRRELLLSAADEARKHGASGEGAKSVSGNLNALIAALRAQPASASVTGSLINAVIVSVLFATHGIHFGDTRESHRQFRNALLALKQRGSSPIGALITNKRLRLETYQADIERRRDDVVANGFPTTVTITSAWVMPDSIAESDRAS
jgi:hypothetical protein